MARGNKKKKARAASPGVPPVSTPSAKWQWEEKEIDHMSSFLSKYRQANSAGRKKIVDYLGATFISERNLDEGNADIVAQFIAGVSRVYCS